MKQTHDIDYQKQQEMQDLTSLLQAQAKLEEKIRINLYLPKIAVKILDQLADNNSRGKLITALIVKEAKLKQKLPYGLFSGLKISQKEIDQIIGQWGKTINEAG